MPESRITTEHDDGRTAGQRQRKTGGAAEARPGDRDSLLEEAAPGADPRRMGAAFATAAAAAAWSSSKTRIPAASTIPTSPAGSWKPAPADAAITAAAASA